MLADLFWIFPGLGTKREVEAMEIGEIMSWHERAVIRKRADLEAAGATAQMLSSIFAARGG